MSQLSQPQPVSLSFAREGEDYVVTVVQGCESVLTLSLSRELIEPVVLASARLQLELRPIGNLVVFSESQEAYDIVARPLRALVAETLALTGPEDDPAELALLESILNEALAAVRAARDETDRASSK